MGKSAGGTTKSAGSMPKTTRVKPTVASADATKSSVSEKAAVDTSKVTSSAPDKVVASEATKPSVTTDKASTADVKATESTTPAVKQASTNTAPPEKSGGTFWPLLIGGALAAVLGFLAAEMNVLGSRGDDSDLRVALRDQQAQIEALQNVEPQVPEIEMPDLAPLTTELAAVSEAIAAMEARLTEVEKRPITGGSSTAAVAAYERELEALQASVKEQRLEIEALLNNALSVEEATADAARDATLQAALSRITAAISDGQPFARPLADLKANGFTDIPFALTGTAETGVVTLVNLQSRFPDTARAVLSVARANGTDEDAGGVTGFLKRQLGARSVTPREGTDPDAILSRAEAAVRDGRLTDALAELDTLPEISQSDLDAWLADARARQAAQSAAEDLSQRLTAN